MYNQVNPNPNFSDLEEAILKFWEENKIFEKSLEKTKVGEPYTFYDGPPFATGLPHYGHILASTIKDVIPRYQTMKGRFVRRRWGWDCHGLPIEEIVERELGISGKKQIEKIGIKKFNETCRSTVLKYVAEWRKMIRRIARWVDFDNSYKTMDQGYMESVWWAFKQFYNKGLVYEGRKVLLYCPRCETPVSNFEVAMDNSYQEVREEAVTVKFQIKSGANTLIHTNNTNSRHSRDDSRHSGRLFLLAWTTTPWTLAGNIALAVGNDIKYVMVRIKDHNAPQPPLNLRGGEGELSPVYIVAKDRLSSVIPGLTRDPGLDSDFRSPRYSYGGAGQNDKKEGENDIEIIKELSGKDLIGLEYEPLYTVPEMASDKSFKVYSADFVNTEEGTGIVHTAVVYGEDDYNLGVKVGLPVVPLLDEKGIFNSKAPELVRGQYFKDSEKAVKEDLEKRGLLFEKKMHLHSYPHCWRCDTALFYNAIPAWFINIQKIKNKLLSSNKKEINWFPEHLKLGRYAKSLEGAPDWNISRNRYWGNPIPVWKCLDCSHNNVIGSVEELEEKSDANTLIHANETNSRHSREDSRHSGRLIDLHRPYIDEVILKCSKCSGEARRVTEIFDSWVEAGSMPFAEFHYPFENEKVFEARMPAQFVAEYIAQTRAWFYVMHVVSYVLFGKAPFENVVTTGTILASDGNKMSKSKNNFPDPWEVIGKFGVDSLRYYLMNSVVMQADNLNFNERDLENANRKVIRILWNVYNYFVTYGNEANFQFSIFNFQKKPGNILDQWVLVRLQELVNNVTKHFDSYDTVKATREMERFISDLSTWYLRRSRGRTDTEFFDTLRHCLVELSRVTAPVMPFISEEIYRNLTSDVNTRMHTNDTTSRHSHDIGEFTSLSVHLADWPKAKKLSKGQEELLVQMQEIRSTAEQAHALRAKAGVKLRQKLGKLKIKDQRSKIKINEELLQILKDEVNVLEISIVSVIPAQAGIQTWILNQVQDDKEPTMALDVALTPELKLEGLARELERQIQMLRKESGLRIGEMVDLYYETSSDMIKEAMEGVDRKKIYVKQISNDKFQMSNAGQGKEIEIEGGKVKFLIIINKSQ